MDKDNFEKNDDIKEKLLAEFKSSGRIQWEQEAISSLKGKPLEKLNSNTYEGINIRPIYFKDDFEKLALAAIDIPGFYPFHRSFNNYNSKEKPFEISLDINYPTAQDVNSFLKDCLRNSDYPITLKLDKPTRNGFNPGKDLNTQAGLDGISIFSVRDFDTLFNGIEINKFPVYLYSDCRSYALAGLYSGYLKSKNIDSFNCTGGFLFDPLEFYEKSGYLITPIKSIFNSIYDTILLSDEFLPSFSVISVNGAVYSNFGANAVQELAFVISKAVLYLREMLNRGLQIDAVAPKITISLSIGQNFFMEIAKLRAIRWLWSKIIKLFGGNEQSQKVKIHSFATGINKSKLDPYNNILRNTSEATGAILGGTDVIHLRNFDELYGFAGDFSNRITRNILNVLKEECNLTATVDPGGGSWYLESLTEELAQNSYLLFQEIEAKGGYVESLKDGFPQEIVEKVEQQRVSNIKTRKNILVGVNKYPDIYEETLETKPYNLEKIATDRYIEFNNIINNRDNSILGKKFEEFQKAIEDCSRQRFKLSLDCAELGATIGEIEFYMNFEEKGKFIIKDFNEIRLATCYEELRQNALEYKERNGSFPNVFIANIGTLTQYKARVDFSLDAFLAGGFEPVIGDGYTEPLTAARAALDSNARIITICSSDDLYPDIVPQFAQYIKQQNSSIKIVLAGYPLDYVEKFHSDGVDDFIHIKSNIYELMTKLHSDLNFIEKEGR